MTISPSILTRHTMHLIINRIGGETDSAIGPECVSCFSLSTDNGSTGKSGRNGRNDSNDANNVSVNRVISVSRIWKARQRTEECDINAM